METIGSGVRVSEDERLTGIEGWLTFALIILSLSALALLAAAVAPLFAKVVTQELRWNAAISGVLLLYLAFVIISFLQKKRRTRMLAIAYFGLSAALSLPVLAMEFGQPNENASFSANTAGLRSLIISLIMIIYFIRSRRVKNTFVE